MSTALSTTPQKIRALRQSLGLTQAQLAAKLNLTQGAVAQWETGRCNPSGSSELLLQQLRDLAASKPARVAR